MVESKSVHCPYCMGEVQVDYRPRTGRYVAIPHSLKAGGTKPCPGSGKEDFKLKQLYTKMKRYVYALWGCVEPEILGPFFTEKERIEAANAFVKEHGKDHADVFRMNILPDGTPTTISFATEEIEGSKTL